jgi:hypothetical protein
LQYVARNMTDWNQRIKDLGIDKIGYTGGTNYLVWASPNELEQAKQFDFVRAVVPYHGEFKIRPTSGITLTVKIMRKQETDLSDWEEYQKTCTHEHRLGEQSMRFGFQLDGPNVSLILLIYA